MTGLEVVGLHCMHKKNWKLSQGFLGSLWEESEGCRGTFYSTLFNCGVEGEYQDMSCQGTGRVSMNGSCLLNHSVSQTYTHSTPPNSHMHTHIGENNIMGLF